MDTTKSKAVVMLPNNGKGKEICARLREELGIPEKCTWFEVRFATNEVVTVKCEYVPIEAVR